MEKNFTEEEVMTKKIAWGVVLGILIIAGAGTLVSQQNGEDAKFVKWADTYLDEYWKFYPTAGTMAGFAKYNDRLEDWSEGNIERHLEQVDKFNAELVNKIMRDKLSPEVQIDFDLVREGLDLDLLRLEKIAPQQTNPLIYNDVLLNCLKGVLTKESLPIEARLAAAAARAKALPGFLKQAKENLKTPPKEYTDAAILQFAAILEFTKTEIPKLIEAADAGAKTKFNAEYAKAVAALDDYGKFLQGELLTRSTGNFRLGNEAHQRILQLTTGDALMPADLSAWAKADTTNIRNEMFKICFPYYKIMDPEFNIEEPPANLTGDGLINRVVAHVLNKIKVNQPTKEEWTSKIKANVDAVKAFIDKTKLLDVPAEVPAVTATPPMPWDFGLARLVAPSPYGANGAFDVEINPYPETLTGEALASFLDEYTNHLLPIWTIQHVYPGSFVPAVATLKNASFIRKLYCPPTLLVGWPHYMQDMFVFAGFNDYDLRQRLGELKLKLRAILDFQIDFNVHEAAYPKEQAVRLMMSTGFQTQAEAERKWNYIVLNPGAASLPYIGYRWIVDMETAYKTAKGDSFSKKEFLQKLISLGPLPIRVLKTKILQ
jgi:uncharacterized protein (DUF885 family)